MSQTIINNVPPRTQGSASGGQVVFGTNWTADAPSDVVVYLTPVNTDADDFLNILNYPSDYSVSFVGALQEVEVTLVNPATLGDKVTIIRMTPADRENLYSNTNFTPSMLNSDFGILTLVDQQAQLVNQSIAPRYNYSATIVPVIDTILPVLGANEIWIKNANNDGFISLTIQGGQVGSGTVNIGSQNQIAYYPANGTVVNGLPTAANSVLVTNPSGAPSISSILPIGISGENMNLLTPTVTGGVFNFPFIDDASIDTPTITNPIVTTGTFTNPTVSSGTFTNSSLNSPTLTNALLGTPTSGVLTNCTGLPSGTGILCTATNNNANAGQLGEVISSTITAPGGGIGNNVAANVTSIVLTAGDWDVYGNTFFLNGIYLWTYGWISGVSATQPDSSLTSSMSIGSGFGFHGYAVPTRRFSLASPTTIYLSCLTRFSAGSSNVSGQIIARRVR